MNRALVTFGVGPHAELLEIALPSYERFADRHGYDVVIPEPINSARPPSWWKIPALIAVLEEYDEALFMGADLVIVDGTDDMPVDSNAWQALVKHKNHCGEVPNADVWYVKRPMIPYLREIWEMRQYTQHGWWEQAALLELMGYHVTGGSAELGEPTLLYERTCFPDGGWNVHIWCDAPTRPRFQHATMHPDRAAVMREWEAQAV